MQSNAVTSAVLPTPAAPDLVPFLVSLNYSWRLCTPAWMRAAVLHWHHLHLPALITTASLTVVCVARGNKHMVCNEWAVLNTEGRFYKGACRASWQLGLWILSLLERLLASAPLTCATSATASVNVLTNGVRMVDWCIPEPPQCGRIPISHSSFHLST